MFNEDGLIAMIGALVVFGVAYLAIKLQSVHSFLLF